MVIDDLVGLVLDGCGVLVVDFGFYVVLIVFNVFLVVGNFVDDGSGEIDEEQKFCNEFCKIFYIFDLLVVGICVWILVYSGYGFVVYVEFCESFSFEKVIELLMQVFGVRVVDVLDFWLVVGIDFLLVGCICVDQFVLVGKGLVFFCVVDNLCKGVVFNVVQFVELVVVE